MKLPLPSNVRLRRAQQHLDKTMYRLIHERRANRRAGRCVVAPTGGPGYLTGTTGMTDKQVHDEALTLLLAGHETTAVALTWTWYLLSQYPWLRRNSMRNSRPSLTVAFPPTRTYPTSSIPRQVFTEAMRLYPPAWMMTRRTLVEYQLGDYALAAGTFLILSPYVTHHDPRFFPDPEVFDPERWAVPADTNQPKLPIFLSEVVHGSALAKALPGWKAFSCWRPWRSSGRCVWSLGIRSSSPLVTLRPRYGGAYDTHLPVPGARHRPAK